MHNAECIMKENAEAFWIIKLRKKNKFTVCG